MPYHSQSRNPKEDPVAGDLDGYDYVIVGAGTAGCVLANRLSRDPGTRVLLLEAGGKDDYFWIDVPVGYLYTIGNPRTDWCYKTEPDPGLNGRSIGYARGKVLGGCSSINAMIYMRGQKSDYDHWAELGNRGWSWDEVLPWFRRTEDYQHGADALHGAGGELRVEERRVSWEILDAWRDAAEECGIPKIREFNRGDNFGNAYFQVNQRRGVRWSATKAFLRPAQHRSNLTVLTDALAHRVRIDTRDGVRRATGVELSLPDGMRTVEAQQGVILAAGAIGSPQILQLSGVGPGALLQRHAIPVIHDLPGVGENLHDHLQIRLMYKVHGVTTLNQRANSLLGKAAMGLEYLLFKTGPLTMPPSQLGAFARSDPSEPSANIEWHVQPLSLDRFGEPLHPFPAITPSVCNLRPVSRGHVRINSADPRAHPAITLNYLSAEEDRRVAVDSIRFTRRIMAAQALAKYSPEEWKPGTSAQSDEALLKAAGDLGTTIFHPVGTCKMGHDALAVVDDRLRVRGIEGLRVIDASVMPRITSGNTNAPTIMIAEKGAEMIAQDRR
jgi:choline dehydrogenase